MNTTLIHDNDCEKRVIGGLLQASLEQIAEIREILDEDCFYDTENRVIYRCICKCADNGNTPSFPNLFRLLGAPKMEYLGELLVSSIGYTDAFQHSHILKEYSVKRNLYAVGSNLVAAASDPNSDIDEVVQRASECLKSSTLTNKSDVSTLGTLSERCVQIMDGNLNGITRGQQTGFSELDNRGGFLNGDLIVIAASTSQGKTSFALSIALNIIESGGKVAFYSLEMSGVQLVARIASHNSQVSPSLILNQKLDDSLYIKAQNEFCRLKDKHGESLFVDENCSSNASRIMNSIRQMVHGKGVCGVFIDYMQIISTSSKSAQNRNQELAEMSRRFKNLAKELNIWIVLISQLNRDKTNAEPDLNRLRDSGEIEEAADLILMIHRPEVYDSQMRYKDDFSNISTKGTALIKIAKGRNVGIGKFILGFSPNTTSFYELAELPQREEEQSFDFKR